MKEKEVHFSKINGRDIFGNPQNLQESNLRVLLEGWTGHLLNHDLSLSQRRSKHVVLRSVAEIVVVKYVNSSGPSARLRSKLAKVVTIWTFWRVSLLNVVSRSSRFVEKCFQCQRV